MWTDKQFWLDASWRAFRTFCQSLAGLLTVQQVSANMNAPWLTLIYASAVAGLISLLQSIDRERVAVKTATTEPDQYSYQYPYSSEPAADPTPTAPLPTPPDGDQRATSPVFGFIPPTHGCGESLR